MKMLATTLSLLLFAAGCADDGSDPVLEDFAEDSETAAEVFELAKESELETASMSADAQRDSALGLLSELELMSTIEADVVRSVLRGDRRAAAAGSYLRQNTQVNAITAMIFAAVDDAIDSRPDLAPASVVAAGVRAAARGARVGAHAGGKRGATFGAITAVHGALVSLLAN